MTAGCVVPRGDVLELIDDIKDAIPGELDDAQDVLDARDSLLHEAKAHADSVMSAATTESDSLLNHARSEADRILADAKAQADRMVGEARQHSERIVCNPEKNRSASPRRQSANTRPSPVAPSRTPTGSSKTATSPTRKPCRRGIKEQQRLVSQTEVVQSANAESGRLIDAAHAEADRLRGECDIYVDSKLAEFEEHLNTTLRSVNRGRHQLRTAAGVRDYAQRWSSLLPAARGGRPMGRRSIAAIARPTPPDSASERQLPSRWPSTSRGSGGARARCSPCRKRWPARRASAWS